MEKQILDASLLIGHWRRRRASVSGATAQAAREWAQQLIGIRRTSAILAPIRIEFLVGATSSGELALFEAYLEAFCCVDEGKFLERDWQEVERLARRIPPDGKPRHLGDCLIRVIANRLKYDVLSADADFPKR